MAVQGDEVHTETDEARGGSTPHIVRWILGISIFLGIVLLSAVWIFGALSQEDIEEEATVGGIAEDMAEGGDTDGVIIDNVDEIETENPEAPLNITNQTEAETDLSDVEEVEEDTLVR